MEMEIIYIDIDPATFERVVTNGEAIQRILRTAAKRLPYYDNRVRDIIDGTFIRFTADKSSIAVTTIAKPDALRVITDISSIIGKQGEPKKEKYFKYLKFEELPEQEKARKIVEVLQEKYEQRMWTLALAGLDTPQMRVDTIEDVISTFIDSYPEEYRDVIIGCREHIDNLSAYAHQM